MLLTSLGVARLVIGLSACVVLFRRAKAEIALNGILCLSNFAGTISVKDCAVVSAVTLSVNWLHFVAQDNGLQHNQCAVNARHGDGGGRLSTPSLVYNSNEAH